ncbi:MAG: acylneuraminate cytidylyltransferase family protein [bacterium]|nr:acylneuraminate cytidylyltransferase family protein [bacterium]
MRILGIIPARGGSKGIPHKNIKPLGGKPLISYTIESAIKSGLLSDYIVSTDDQSIAEVAEKAGADVPFLRPAPLASDQSPTLPVIEHAIRFFLEQGKQYDAICILQPTSPFRPSDLIDQGIKKFVKSESDALVSVRSVPHEYNPHWVFEPDQAGLLKIATGEENIISRRQELPPAYIRDGALYLTRTEVILHQKSLYGRTLSFIENKNDVHVNLDTLLDWQLAEQLLDNFLNREKAS